MIRVWRDALGATVAEVAQRAGVEAEYLEQVEQGVEVAPESLLSRLSKILGQWMTEG